MNGIEEGIIARAQYLLQEQARGKDLIGLCAGAEEDNSAEVQSAVRLDPTIAWNNTDSAKEQIARHLLRLDVKDREVDLSQWLSSALAQTEIDGKPQTSAELETSEE